MGLGAGESQRDLAKPIRAQLAATATACAEPDDADPCDSVVAAQVEYDGEDEMRAEAAVTLQTEVEGELLVDTSSDRKVAMGKRRGLNISTEMLELRSEISELESGVGGLKNFRKETISRIASMESQIQSLSKSLPQYRHVRARFISTYKRDVLKNATDADIEIIRSGDMWAHGGDAFMDA